MRPSQPLSWGFRFFLLPLLAAVSYGYDTTTTLVVTRNASDSILEQKLNRSIYQNGKLLSLLDSNWISGARFRLEYSYNDTLLSRKAAWVNGVFDSTLLVNVYHDSLNRMRAIIQYSENGDTNYTTSIFYQYDSLGRKRITYGDEGNQLYRERDLLDNCGNKIGVIVTTDSTIDTLVQRKLNYGINCSQIASSYEYGDKSKGDIRVIKRFSNNRLTTKEYYLPPDTSSGSDTTLYKTRDVFTYPDSNTINIKSTKIATGDTVVLKYGCMVKKPTGSIIERKIWNADSALTLKELFTYDFNDSLLSYRYFKNDTLELHEKRTQFSRDGCGRILKKVSYDSNGDTLLVNTYTHQ